MKTFREHIWEVRQDGISVLLRKSKNFVISKTPLILQAPIAIPGVIIIRLIRPWIHVRLGYFWEDRIGHFSIDAGLALAEYELNSDDSYLDWYSLSRKTCNQQWAKMIKRNFRVRWWVSLFHNWNMLVPGSDVHVRRPGLEHDYLDKGGWLSKTSKRMAFLSEEENEAKSWLRKEGWKDGEPFVCLLVRDSAYLEQNNLHQWAKEKNEYHSYRDSDISTYVQAAEYLAEQGIWVLRMGKEMKNPIPSPHPKVIDYAFHPEKSDLLDVWLFANCDFCVSTGSGPDSISEVYGRSLLYVNYIPLSHIVSWGNSFTIPKHLMWQKNGKHLTLKEYLHHKYDQTKDYDQAGIAIKDLTSQEISEAVSERLKCLNGSWQDTAEDRDLQDRFWKQLKEWPKFSQYHGWIHPEARVAAHFLRKVGDAFFE
jgi:putative glycosyltransferase (TIGR04372 family)